MADVVKKNRNGYGYKYADISAVHEYLESIGASYYQYIETHEMTGEDYIITVPIIDGKELPPRRGCKVVDATLKGVNNPAMAHGSALTYARRYSLYMAFGLATEDDDGKACDIVDKKAAGASDQKEISIDSVLRILEGKGVPEEYVLNLYGIKDKTKATQAKVQNINKHMVDIVKKYREEK